MTLSYVVMTLVRYEGACQIKSFSDAGKAHLAACRATVNVQNDETVVMNVDNDGESVLRLTYVNGGCTDWYRIDDTNWMP